MQRLPRDKPNILLQLEPLFTSGFVSQRRGIVDLTIASWNVSFGREPTLSYPPQLEQALRRLRGTAKLSLPGLEARDGDDVSWKLNLYHSRNVTDSGRILHPRFTNLKATRK